MAQWKNTNDAANSANWGAATINAGAGRSNEAANNTALFNNTTPAAFTTARALKQTIGQFGVQKAAIANTSGEGKKTSAPGWNLRRAGAGPVLTLTAVNGSGFANGETGQLTGGLSNANGAFVLTTNATGNLVTAVVTKGGTFTNSSSASVAFNREKHVANVTVTGGTAAFSNSDYIVVSNGSINAVANLSTNATGGITNANFTITNIGLFGNTQTAGQTVINAYAANGAVSNGTGATFADLLATSSSGTVAVATVGGRAGRVHYECLVESSSIGTGAGSNSTVLPIT